MHALLFWLAVATAGFWVAVLLLLGQGARHLLRLVDQPPLAPAEMPSVSIVVAARNEATTIEPALRSLLAQQVPRLQVVVVNDRSDDATGAILDRVAGAEPRLEVVHLSEVPAGWLGKNHALQRGAERARGELLLFTDADVVLRPDTLAHAAALLRRTGADHLVAAPKVVLPGALLQAFGVVFGIGFALWTRPWRVRDPSSRAHIGVGAFNLLRSEVYRAIGGHQPLRMRPDDDLKLGKLVKLRGYRQEFAAGAELLRVEWYHSLGEAIRGLRKNSFSAVEYRLSLVVLASLAALLVAVWPWLGLFLTGGPTRWLNLGVVLVLMALFAGAAREQEVPLRYAPLFPLGALLVIAVLCNSTLYTLRHRGIEWRGTHYPLDQLRANRL